MNVPWKPLIAAGICGFGLLAALLAVIAALNRHDELVGLNQEIQYDDFAFSVLEVRLSPSLAAFSGAPSRGRFYVLRLRVVNHAKRVSFRFKPESAVLVDDAGREHRISAAGQSALQSTGGVGDCGRELPAGDSCVAELVFDLPKNVKPAHVRISSAGPIGDIADSIFFGNKRIRLP